MNLRLSDFDYHLPSSRIAQSPARRREEARLLVLNRRDGSISHERFYDIGKYLNPGDALILNDTKVTPSRLFGHRTDTGGKVELLLTSKISEREWEALIRPHKKGLQGVTIEFGDADLTCRVQELKENGKAMLLFSSSGSIMEKLHQQGRTPLPPYIKRDYASADSAIEEADRKRYQTVYAKHEGALAAPTAGLHFSSSLLENLSSEGVRIVTITLHIGLGTFKPVRSEDIVSHQMDAEHYIITPESAEVINETRNSGGRVVCVGTTTTRSIESCAGGDGSVEARADWSSLFIHPGYKFRAVDALLTNFHLPKSTPMMMVAAFIGLDTTLRAYEEAVESGYRFYSYGDAMLII